MESQLLQLDAGDSIIFFNFRPDRARQLTRAFIDEVFNHFEREKRYLPVFFVSMTQYDETFETYMWRISRKTGEYSW